MISRLIILLLIVGCEEPEVLVTETEEEEVITTMYGWVSVKGFSNLDCSGTEFTGHCLLLTTGMPGYAITKANCTIEIGYWSTLYSIYREVYEVPSETVYLSSDYSATYIIGETLPDSTVATTYSCTYTENNNAITLTLPSGQVVEFIRDGNSLIRTIIDETSATSSCIQYKYQEVNFVMPPGGWI